MLNGSLYGNYRTRTFADIFKSSDDFYNFYHNNGAIPETISEQSVRVLWALLYGKHGNDCIKSSDENRFKFQLISIVWQYGPTWQRKIEIQKKLRELTDAEITAGTQMIVGEGINPSTQLSDTEIEGAGVNNYSRQRYKKSPLEGYANLLGLLENDVTSEFINRFGKLFRQIAVPDAALWYEDPNIEED